MNLGDASRAKVLVLEDQELLRRSMVRGIATLGGVDVLEAGTLAEARNQLARHRPKVMVADIQLPDGIATDLLADLDRTGLRLPVIFVSGFIGAYRDLIPQRIDIEIREKPIPIEELRDLVREKLEAPQGAVGDAPFSLQDYLQLAHLGHHSVSFFVERNGHQIGKVVTHLGQIWTARDLQGVGDAAVQRLFVTGTQDPEVRIRCQRVQGDPPPRNVDASAPALLLEAARLMDEGRSDELALHASRPEEEDLEEVQAEEVDLADDEGVLTPALAPPPPPPPSSVRPTAIAGLWSEPQAPPPPGLELRTTGLSQRPAEVHLEGRTDPHLVNGAVTRGELQPQVRSLPRPVKAPDAPGEGKASGARPEDFDALFDSGIDALLRKDFREALSAFRAARTLRPDNNLVIANLRRLKDMGYPGPEETP